MEEGRLSKLMGYLSGYDVLKRKIRKKAKGTKLH